jgi:ubiquinone/menaquinone biosynthesis C-methylase UbiE
MSNKEWSEKILLKSDPLFKHRWEVYGNLLKEKLNSDTVWIDCGCGNNGDIRSFGPLAKTAIGIDVTDPEYKINFIKGDIRNLPLPEEYADLITLRFVAEHFLNVNEYMSELSRVTKKGGKIIILTTNLLSPLIFFPKLLLPSPLRQKLLTILFKVKEDNVFPAYHKLNTPGKFHKINAGLKVTKMEYLSDINYTRKWIFIVFLIWHRITGIKPLKKFRTNLLVILEKV